MSGKISKSDAENLSKLTRLLDKTENEIKKKREDNVYSQTTEKFLEHMKKTSEVYSLVIDEVIGSLYVMGYNEHTDVLKKLFRGVQQQITSVLKFSLKYYIQKSSELEGVDPKAKQKIKEEPVEVLIDKRTLLPYCETHLKGKKTQKFVSSGSKITDLPSVSSRASPKHYVPSHINFNGTKNSSQLSQFAQPHATDLGHSAFRPGGHPTPGHYAGSPHMGSPNMPRGRDPRNLSVNTSDHYNNYGDADSEMDSFKQDTDLMQREIDDLLEGKKNLDNYISTDISTSLKQVLKGLEGFRKKVKAMGDENREDDGEEDNELDLADLTGNVMGAFEKAQMKTAKQVIGYTRNKPVDTKHTQSIGTMPDAEMLEAEKKFYRKDLELTLEQKLEELNFVKKKIVLLEQDRNGIHDKYAKLTMEHSTCDQNLKELQIKINSIEKECDHLKKLIEDVKKGKVERLFLSKEQEELVKKNIQMIQNPEDMNQVLMIKLQESRREAKILKYQLQHNGERPPSSYLEENDDDDSISVLQLNARSTPNGKRVVPAKKSNRSKYAENAQQEAEAPEAFEIEEEVIVDGKAVKVKKTVYRQKTKKIVTNEKGEKVEVEEYVDVDESEVAKYGKLLKGASSSNTKTGPNGKKLVKIVTKNKNGEEISQWVGSTEDVDINGDENDNVIIRAANGKTMKKVVKKDRNGNDIVEWAEIGEDDIYDGDDNGNNGNNGTYGNRGANKYRNRSIGQKKEDGVMMLEEEVEVEETIIDENGNAVVVKKKVVRTKQVKKFVDENGEEVIEEEVVDPETGEKVTVRRKVKELENAKLVQLDDNNSDNYQNTNTDDVQSVYSARGTRRLIGHKEVQTIFLVEDMIKSALASAGIKGEALTAINKILMKSGVDLNKPKVNRRENTEESEYVMIPGQGKKKVVYTQGQDIEEVEFVTKDGRVIKKKVPRGAKDEYEVAEDGTLVHKGPTGKVKANLLRGRQPKIDPSLSKLDESMVSVMSTDEEGNSVKKKKPKRLVPVDQGGSKKLTLDDYIRREEELENKGVPLTKEEAQSRAMYKAMLTKAKQDPKMMDMFKKYMKEKGVNIEDDANFIVDFDNFKGFLDNFKERHKRCGETCSHLQKFYARIGFYPQWNNRVPLEMKKPEIAKDHRPEPAQSPVPGRTIKLPMISPRRAVGSRTHF